MFEILAHSVPADVNALDLLTKVGDFYSQAFYMLVTVLSVGLIVVGIVMPYVIHRLQQRSFRKTEEKLQKQIAETRDDAFHEIEAKTVSVENRILKKQGEVEKGLVEKQEEMEQRLLKRMAIESAWQYATHAGILPEDKINRTYAMYLYLESATYFAVAGNESQIYSSIISAAAQLVSMDTYSYNKEESEAIHGYITQAINSICNAIKENHCGEKNLDRLESLREKVEEVFKSPENAE